MLPDITIVVTTWFPKGNHNLARDRMEAVQDTVLSWQNYMRYQGRVRYHIADDGSYGNHLDYLYDWFQSFITKDVTMSTQPRQGVGTSLNVGFKIAYSVSPLVLYAVDDWSLTTTLDLNPWAKLLVRREDIGMVRLGPPHPNIRGRVEHLNDLGWGLLLERYTYIYAQRPALYHERFTRAYGMFPQNKSAIDAEREYNERVVSSEGPDVMLALYTPWEHIYTESLSDLTPENNNE